MPNAKNQQNDKIDPDGYHDAADDDHVYHHGYFRWAFGIWHLAFGIWHLAFGIWHLAFGIWHQASGII